MDTSSQQGTAISPGRVVAQASIHFYRSLKHLKQLFGLALIAPALVFALFAAPAQAGVEELWEYTVTGLPLVNSRPQSFKTLEEAEAAMRAMTDKFLSGYNIYEQHALLEQYSTSESLISKALYYKVRNRPASLSPPWYYASAGSCMGARLCTSEAAAVQGVVDYLFATYKISTTPTPTTDWYISYPAGIGPEFVSFWISAAQYQKKYNFNGVNSTGTKVTFAHLINRNADPYCADANFVVTTSIVDPPYTPSRWTRLEEGCSNPTTGSITAKLVLIPQPKPKKCDTVGNPCSPVTGNKSETETDFSAAPGAGIGFQRSYNSRQDVLNASPLGRGWSHTYSRRLTTLTGTYRAAMRADGSMEIWNYAATNVYVSAHGTGTQLRLINNEWVVLDPSGEREVYDTAGQLLRLETAAGLRTTLTYDTRRRVSRVTGPFGHTLAFTYHPTTGKLISVTDSAGRTVNYSQDGERLAQVTYPDGRTRSYHYENAGLPYHLTGISEDGVRYSTFAYDAWGRATLTEHAGGLERHTLAYNADGTTTVTDAAGKTTVYSFVNPNTVPRILSKITDSLGSDTYSYDTSWRTTAETNARGVKTTSTYDTYHLTSRTEATGVAEARTTTYQYLSTDSDLPTVIESPSVVSGQKKRTTISYAGKLPSVITQSGYTPSGAAVSRSTAMQYNSLGQVVTIDGPRTDVADITTLDYYTCTTGGACGQLRSITNALGQTTYFDAYDANGRVTQQSDANGVITGYAYDTRGRVSAVGQTPPGGATRVTAYTYDGAGQLTSVQTPDGKTLVYSYDAAHKLARVTDNLGNRVDYGYDLKGNRVSEAVYDPGNTLVKSIQSSFDLRNRLSAVNNGGSLSQYLNDAVGNVTQTVTPNGFASVNGYDALNRLLQSVDALSGVTRYTYNAHDRLTQVQAPNNATTQYQYDDLGNLLSETSPDRGTTTYAYDSAGNRATHTDARSITALYSYDALNRPTRIDYPGTAEDVMLTYDACAGGAGRLCQVQDESGLSQYTYDGFGNVLTHTRSELGIVYTTRYAYDAANRVIGITYPNGRGVSYTRDTLGRIVQVNATVNGVNTALAGNIQRRPDGSIAAQAFGNGLTEVRQYNLKGELTYQSLGSDTRLYSYDPNGNLTSKQTLPEVGSYGYDALDRLLQESRTTQATTTTGWSYDPNGNRTAQNGQAYIYASATNRLAQTPFGTVLLDAAGNTVSDGTRGYGYNAAGHLSQAGAVSYSYNAQRQRTRKVNGPETTVYHYDITGNLLAETRADGVLIRDYVWLDSAPIAQVEAGEKISYLHGDHLNTPRLATNVQGQIVWRWEGSAFGDTPANDDPDGDGVRVTVNLRYPGQYYDAESGLHYNWNRYYDPKTGRYLTPDPVGVNVHARRAGTRLRQDGRTGNRPPVELNPYAYVANNPLRWIDHFGLAIKGIWASLDPVEEPEKWFYAAVPTNAGWDDTSLRVTVWGGGYLQGVVHCVQDCPAREWDVKPKLDAPTLAIYNDILPLEMFLDNYQDSFYGLTQGMWAGNRYIQELRESWLATDPSHFCWSRSRE